MSDIFSTSCSYKPKEYNPEHEVFLRGILSFPVRQDSWWGHKGEPFFCLPPHTPFTWGGNISIWMPSFRFGVSQVEARRNSAASQSYSHWTVEWGGTNSLGAVNRSSPRFLHLGSRPLPCCASSCSWHSPWQRRKGGRGFSFSHPDTCIQDLHLNSH